MDIRKTKDKNNKNRKLKYLNYNLYKYIAKNCRKLKKEKEIRKCYKYNKVEYLIKHCRLEQNIKNRNIQDNSNNKKHNKEEDFVGDLEQKQYNKSLYIVVLQRINILFYKGEITKRENLIYA